MTTDGSALATDLYELTMAAGYWTAGMDQRASFELYVRELPEERNYLLCAGLEQALDYLEGLRFTSSEIDYLRHLPVFGDIPGKFFDEFLPSF
jgi:nicotinate phosphoribosyltransferase